LREMAAHDGAAAASTLAHVAGGVTSACAVLSLRDAVSMRAWLCRLGAWTRERGGSGADAASPSIGHIVFLSGPEGGLSANEEEAALALGWQAVSLGHRVLRADTAPLAALSVIACAHEG